MTDNVTKKVCVDHFIQRWPSKFFILIGCSILHMQLWCHNKGTYDVILIPHEYLRGVKFQFCPWCGFIDAEVQSFSIFPILLPHHVTYDIIIIMRTFYLSSRTYCENLVSIQQVVAEKNTKVLCGQTKTDRQTDRDTDRQTQIAISSRLAREINVALNHRLKFFHNERK